MIYQNTKKGVTSYLRNIRKTEQNTLLNVISNHFKHYDDHVYELIEVKMHIASANTN